MIKKLLSLVVSITLLAAVSFTVAEAQYLPLTNETATQAVQEVKAELLVLASREINALVVSTVENTNTFGYCMSQNIYPLQQTTILLNFGWSKNLYNPPPETNYFIPDVIMQDPNAVITIIFNADVCNTMSDVSIKGIIAQELVLLHDWKCGYTNSMDIFTTHGYPTRDRISGMYLMDKTNLIIPFFEFSKWVDEVFAPPINGISQWVGLTTPDIRTFYCRNIDLLVEYGYSLYITPQEWDIYNYLQSN